MADEPKDREQPQVPLPPKLDLRSKGILRTPAFTPKATTKPDPSLPQPPEPAKPVTPPAESPGTETQEPPTTPPPPFAFAPPLPTAAGTQKPIMTQAPKPSPPALPSLSAAPKPIPPVESVKLVAPAIESDASPTKLVVPRISLTPRVEAPRPPGTPTGVPQKPSTPVARPGFAPAAAGPTQPAPAATPTGIKPPDKGKTSRIPLEIATGGIGGTSDAKPGAPKTIKIHPTLSPGSTARVPGQIPIPKGTFPADSTLEKSKTSRISLESAMEAPDAEPKADADSRKAPKTVKIRVPGKPASAVKTGPTPEAQDSLSKTAHLDVQTPEADEGSTTRRKTIKIRRPGQKSGLKLAPVTRMPGTTIPAPQAAAEEAPAKSGVSDLIFSLVGIAAVLVACVVIYVLAAQVNPAMGLSWPGKITAVQ